MSVTWQNLYSNAAYITCNSVYLFFWAARPGPNSRVRNMTARICMWQIAVCNSAFMFSRVAASLLTITTDNNTD
ncbi:hypothetical protein V1511DRAFT_496906 [Dipodascopsis uninucleata]